MAHKWLLKVIDSRALDSTTRLGEGSIFISNINIQLPIL